MEELKKKDRRVCGNFGSNTMKRNGRLLIEFCNEQRYKIMNTFKSVKRKNSYSYKEDMEMDKV